MWRCIQCSSFLSLWRLFTVQAIFLSPGSRLIHTKPAAFSAFLCSPQGCFPHPQHLPHLPDVSSHSWWGLWLLSTPAREGPCLTLYCRAVWSPWRSSARARPGCMKSRHMHPRRDFFQESQLRLSLDPSLLVEHFHGSHLGTPQLGWDVLACFCSLTCKTMTGAACRHGSKPGTAGLAHPTISLTPGSSWAAAWQVLPTLCGSAWCWTTTVCSVIASGGMNDVTRS